ncbi:MAG: PAS domain S-box protein [Fimbriimonas sp.]
MFRAIIDAFPDATFATDEEGTILFANAQLENLLGYAPQELVGQAATLLFSSRSQEHPFDELAAFAQEPCPVRIGTGRVIYARRKDGHIVRVTMAMDGRKISQGVVVTCVLRAFLDEIEDARRRASAVVESFIDPSDLAKMSLRTELR